MAEQQRDEQRVLRVASIVPTPWSMRLASWAWGSAGAFLVTTPLLATLFLWLQYRSLRKNAFRIADLTEWLIPPETVDLEPYIAMFGRIEAWLVNTSGWLFLVVVALYLVAAGAILAAYLMTSKYTALGSRTARVFGTVLAAISSVLVFMLWQAFLAISWIPIDALWANHLGLVIIALHLCGSVLVWLPTSNAFVREVVLRRSTPSAA